VLEKAILAAGLISEANFGDFRRTKWTSSSRWALFFPGLKVSR
jgi:hypothetical protein